jgi:hypothetical protein
MIMRIDRLADLFDYKYELSSIEKAAAVSPSDVFKQVKDSILTNYTHWVMGKYRALKLLAEFGEPHAKALYDAYNEIVANIDSLNHIQLFHRINALLNMIREMKANPSVYRNSIHDSVEVKKESDRNYREQLKSGFETNLSNISFGLEKVAKALQRYVASSQLHGGAVEPQRKALSKEKLRMFMVTPAAQFYKLDNIDVMQQVLSFPETRDKLTTLINAIDRGQVPADGPDVMAEASAIRQWLNNKEKTNLPALEEEMPENEGKETE